MDPTLSPAADPPTDTTNIAGPPPGMAASAFPPGAASPGLRWYLYLTAAVTGAAVMVVEILGAKILAPFVGTSHFVWTAQIAVTLAALAGGYFVGGTLADRRPRPGPMYAAIAAAAVYLGLTVPFAETVAFACLRYELAVGSLLASAALFLVPLALLAMTGPYFVRVLTVAVAGVGGNVGRLSAVGTAGSLAGTLLVGYVLVPRMPNSATMTVTAAALAAVSLGYFLVWGRTQSRVVATLAVAGTVWAGVVGVGREAGTIAPNAKPEDVELYRANSNFGRLQVVRSGRDGRLSYLNDLLTQNTYDPAVGDSASMFTYALHGLADGYVARPGRDGEPDAAGTVGPVAPLDDVLCIGMGVGIVPMTFAREGAKVDVVEINPAVVPVAERFFGFDPAKVNVTVGDGRQFVNASAAGRYDAVVLDAFLGDSSPSHLMSRQAFASIRRAMRPGGVLVINAFCDFEQGKDFYAGSLDKTLKAVFATVRIHAAGNGNVFFVATDQPDPHLRREPDPAAVHPTCRDEVAAAMTGIQKVDQAAGIVLTDDYNPVEFYDAANRESYRLAIAGALKLRGE